MRAWGSAEATSVRVEGNVRRESLTVVFVNTTTLCVSRPSINSWLEALEATCFRTSVTQQQEDENKTTVFGAEA